MKTYWPFIVNVSRTFTNKTEGDQLVFDLKTKRPAKVNEAENKPADLNAAKDQKGEKEPAEHASKFSWKQRPATWISIVSLSAVFLVMIVVGLVILCRKFLRPKSRGAHSGEVGNNNLTI